MSHPRPKQHKNPCRECPFRRLAHPGRTGGMPPEQFIDGMRKEHLQPCHMTTKYDYPGWHEEFEVGENGNLCAGSLIHRSNLGVTPNRPELPALSADPTEVFDDSREFVSHHRSNDDPEDGNIYDNTFTIGHTQRLREEIGMEPFGGPVLTEAQSLIALLYRKLSNEGLV